jgi:hypothetical protein
MPHHHNLHGPHTHSNGDHTTTSAAPATQQLKETLHIMVAQGGNHPLRRQLSAHMAAALAHCRQPQHNHGQLTCVQLLA